MNGFVFLDKKEDMTSFSASAKLRGIYSTKKVGHTGTLDPMATGVLVIAVGNATRFIELVSDHDKGYKASFTLGTVTDTLDITGKVLRQSEVNVTKEQVEKATFEFLGKIRQVPPMYSAIKKDGVRLYELARQGIEIERQEREVEIKELSIACLNEKKGEYELYVLCSKGTYIRSLIYDIGERLSCGAVMTALRRIKANGVSIEKAITLEELQALKDENRQNEALTPVEEFLPYEKITVSSPQAKRFSNGGELDLQRVRCEKKEGLYRVYSPENEFLGVGEIDKEKTALKVKRVYVR